jgi:hypothetical protein
MRRRGYKPSTSAQDYTPPYYQRVAGTGGTSYLMTAQAGTFSITGQSVTTTVARALSATFGAFAITGQSVTLKVAHLVSASAGTFAITGQSVTLLQTKTVSATHGLFALTGQNAAAAVARVVSAGFGAFAITGQDVTLVVTSGHLAYAMTAQAGSFGITGQNVTLVVTPAPPAPPVFRGGGYGGIMPRFWVDKLMPTLKKRYEEAKPEPIPEPEPALTPQSIVAILSHLSFIIRKPEIQAIPSRSLDMAIVQLRQIAERVKNAPSLPTVDVRSPEELALVLRKARIKEEDQEVLDLILTEVA